MLPSACRGQRLDVNAQELRHDTPNRRWQLCGVTARYAVPLWRVDARSGAWCGCYARLHPRRGWTVDRGWTVGRGWTVDGQRPGRRWAQTLLHARARAPAAFCWFRCPALSVGGCARGTRKCTSLPYTRPTKVMARAGSTQVRRCHVNSPSECPRQLGRDSGRRMIDDLGYKSG